ncbi:MAG: hypothetical protein KAW39_09510 [Thermoplasmata archaeon]|nr:hypothetical protein [Thermoplasmata archaeon]
MRALACVLAMLFVFSFAASAFAATPEEISGMYGGDFRVAVKDTTLNLNPSTASDEASLHVIGLLYDSLGRLDPVTLHVVPWVADSWSVDMGGQTVDIVLRTDVLWHDDGSAVEADDVEYTYESFYGGYVVNVVSPTEVSFDFSGGGGGKFMTEGLQKPLVKLGETTPDEGCGPFELISAAADSVAIGAYDGYFNGRPYLDTMIFDVYQNISQAAIALISEEIDFIGWTLDINDPYDEHNVSGNLTSMGSIEETHLAISTGHGLEYLFVAYNPIDELASPDLRRALALSINKELYNSMEPNTRIVQSPMSPFNEPWYNRSIAEYNAGFYFDSTGRQASNPMPALTELAQLNYIDRDGDGLRERPDGSAIQMTMLGPSQSVDQRKFDIGYNYEGLLSSLGLDITLNTTATDPSGFDVYVDVDKLPLEPAAIRDISMLAGYDVLHPEIMAALDAADDELDVATRQMYVHQALGLISELVPFVPITAYDAIEAVNRERWDGSVQMVGGIFNFWSAINIHKVRTGSLSVSVSTSQPSVESGSNITVTVRVLDQGFAAVPGINVELSASIGTFESAIGTTDSFGTFETNYLASSVSVSVDVLIEATAYMQTYAGSTDGIEVTVHPADNPLKVVVSRLTPVIDSGQATTVSAVITDKDGLYVPGCTLHMTMDLGGGTLGTLSEVTDGQWSASFEGNVTSDTNFRVTAVVQKAGYQEASGFTNVVVRGWGGVQPAEIEKTESIPDVGILAMVSVTLVALLVMAYRRREH